VIMKGLVIFFSGVLLGFAVGWLMTYSLQFWPEKVPEATEEIVQPLLKYTIENLGKREYKSEILWDEITATKSGFFVQKFHFDSDGKTVTGLAHLPKSCEKCPVIVQIRGYAEPENYQSGFGTWRSAEKFAEAGFISLAPDFLGYGGSASPSADVFEERFEKYTTVLNLLSAISHWSLVDNQKIGIWGHSNGGQIALTVLVVAGKDYPTTFWAPVTADFPYSILYYMNDNSDGDKHLRKKLVDFEEVYESNWFNWAGYIENIIAPIQIHQGTADKSVPANWSREVVKRLSDLGKEVKYFEYPGADHNLIPDWDIVVKRDIEYFKKYLGLTE
jgi:dipeptidyl aminopeptidase/acylaminoacyl peptidase